MSIRISNALTNCSEEKKERRGNLNKISIWLLSRLNLCLHLSKMDGFQFYLIGNFN